MHIFSCRIQKAFVSLNVGWKLYIFQVSLIWFWVRSKSKSLVAFLHLTINCAITFSWAPAVIYPAFPASPCASAFVFRVCTHSSVLPTALKLLRSGEKAWRGHPKPDYRSPPTFTPIQQSSFNTEKMGSGSTANIQHNSPVGMGHRKDKKMYCWNTQGMVACLVLKVRDKVHNLLHSIH